MIPVVSALFSSLPRRLGLAGLALAGLVLAAGPVASFAAAPPTPHPVRQSEHFARVRAHFEHLSVMGAIEAGWSPIPNGLSCVASPLGGMGYHFINQRAYQPQWRTGHFRDGEPGIILFDDSGKVIGLEWEANQFVPEQPKLFGQLVELLPGHPGQRAPHYMLHAYFYPNDQVLFAEWDPNVHCPPPSGLPGWLLPLLPQ